MPLDDNVHSCKNRSSTKCHGCHVTCLPSLIPSFCIVQMDGLLCDCKDELFLHFMLPPATKLGQGYVFTRVCDSVHIGGLPDTPPRADTPLHSACWDIVNKRAVRILLECILVMQMLLFVFDELNVIEKSF